MGKYDVVETNTDFAGYELKRSSVTSGSATLANNGDEKTIALKDEYSELKGSLTIKKQVTSNDNGAALTSIKVTIKDANAAKWLKADGSISTSEVTVDVPVANGLKINNVPQGTYIVSEKINSAEISGYTWKAEGSTTEKTVEIKFSESNANALNQVAELTNNYEKEVTPVTAKLTVKKAVVVDEGTVEGTFKFKVKNASGEFVKVTDGVVSYVTEADGTTFDVTAGGSVAITGLAQDKYSVVEDTNNVAVEGYTFKGVTYTQDADLTTATEGEITITNTYEKDSTTPGPVDEPVKLSVTKTVVTSDNTAVTRSFGFKVKNDTEGYVVVATDGTVSFAAAKEDGTTFTVAAGATKDIEGLKKGNYTIEEDTSDVDVDGYTFDASDSTVTATADLTSDDGSATLINKYTKKEAPKTKINISKVDATNSKEIAGATLYLYKVVDGKQVEVTHWISSATEVYSFEVTEGSYVIKETVAPAGYKKVDTTVTFDVVGDSVMNVGGNGKWNATKKVIEFQNDPIRISISKVDAVSSKEVAGATIVLTKPDKKVETWTSTNTPKVFDLIAGDYTLEETSAPSGYKKAETKITFTVDEYGKVSNVKGPGEVGADGVLKFKNVKLTGGIDILVRDEVTKEPVPGATVRVKKPDGTEETFTTDDKGMITKFSEKDADGNFTADVGDYEVTVTDVPEGYSVTTGKKQTETVEEGTLKHVVAEINTETGGLVIRVVDEKTDKPVPGATVVVKKPDGTEETLVTDKDGYIRKFEEKDDKGHYKATPGTYEITVKKVPDGYTVTVGKTEKVTVETGTVKEHVAKIATTPKNDTNNKTNNNTTKKKTGDTTPIVLIVVIMILSMAAVAFIAVKKRKMSR